MTWSKASILPLCLSLSLSFALSSCSVALDDPEEDKRESFEYENWSSNPPSSTYEYQKCEGSFMAVMSFCGTKSGAMISSQSPQYGYSWKPNCASGECAVVSVFAHYNLSEHLGSQQTMHIEAFDNPKFSGSPKASLQIAGFNATPGKFTDREEIYLAPGEYYFRAYLAPSDNIPLPYALGGMELVTDAPVGFYGAASGAKRVLVQDKDVSVHIEINQLYKKPELDSESQAMVRLMMEVDSLAALEKNRKVRIRFYNKADVESSMLYDFTFDSNNFFIEDQKNIATFLSPSIKPGPYYVFAFVDNNGNEFYESNEPASFVKDSQGEPQLVTIEKNQTRNFNINLK